MRRVLAVAVIAVLASVALIVDLAAVAPAQPASDFAGQAPPVTSDATVQRVDEAAAASGCTAPNHVRRSHWKWCNIVLGIGVDHDLVRWWQVAGGVWYCRFHSTWYGSPRGSTPVVQDLGYQTVSC
jgi:hypothetical protein